MYVRSTWRRLSHRLQLLFRGIDLVGVYWSMYNIIFTVIFPRKGRVDGYIGGRESGALRLKHLVKEIRTHGGPLSPPVRMLFIITFIQLQSLTELYSDSDKLPSEQKSRSVACLDRLRDDK